MGTRKSFALILLLASSLPAQQTVPLPTAAATASPPNLTLADAEALALKNHPQVLASQAGTLRSDQLIREQQSAFYPAVNADITGSEANPNARIGAGYLTDSRLFTRFGYGITLSQLITDSGRTPNLVASSKLQAEASRQDYQAAKDDVVLAVNQAYFGVLLAQQEVELSHQTVKARQTVVDQITELTRNKLKSEVDLSFSQVNLSDARLMLLRAQNNLNSAFATLAQSLGTSQTTRYQLQAQSLPPPPPDDPELLVHEALSHRPEVASLHLQHQSDQKFEAAERDLKRPVVNVTAVAGFLPLIKPGTANPDIPSEYQGAALNVEIPVFNGHLFSAREKAAAYQAEVSSQRERDLKDRIARDVRNAWGRARTAYQAISASQELLKESNAALDLAQGRYDLGLSSIVELTQAQLLQTQAQVGLLNTQFEYQQAYSALQYEQGFLH